jgi:hypothetical protein
MMFLLLACSTVDIPFYKYDEARSCFALTPVAMPRDEGWGVWADKYFWGACNFEEPSHFPDEAGECWLLKVQCEVDNERMGVEWAADDTGMAGVKRCESHTAGAPDCPE